jgi:uncharacterized membrane protein
MHPVYRYFVCINTRGWASGFSTLIGDATQHATVWRNGTPLDLGTLGGDNSGVEWLVHNEKGQIAGISETGTPNPYGEIWSCGFFFPSFTHQNCRGFVWQDGVMIELPTLGGDNGYAAGMNVSVRSPAGPRHHVPRSHLQSSAGAPVQRSSMVLAG